MDFLEYYWWIWAAVCLATALYIVRKLTTDLLALSRISYADDTRTERERALLALRPRGYRAAIISAMIMVMYISGAFLALAIVAHLTGGK